MIQILCGVYQYFHNKGTFVCHGMDQDLFWFIKTYINQRSRNRLGPPIRKNRIWPSSSKSNEELFVWCQLNMFVPAFHMCTRTVGSIKHRA